ncbi:PIN domain-like protein [Ceratobasidium sp. AG-I]|nr:PIN domain-like protein [Ceratobasidium sp. AG-I]
MGVKQLWTLLSPVGRPVPLESLEGQILAIDSSIWLYQFQATMRDKDGRALVNAHILGFLRRISKLLFYGIKPVFVFDGGAPVLKRNTIAERKKRKSGAAASHAKVAEKLLAAQLRREALRHAEERDKGPAVVSPPKGKQSTNTTGGDDNYLDDLSGPLLVLPGKHNAPTYSKEPSTNISPPKPKSTATSTSPTKKNFRDHDPYRLPELTENITARAQPNDPRLATDEELRTYVSYLRPDDPQFHELPTDVQYEILGELRLKSRTTSHKRLQKMLRQSKTPMDFSMAQIKNLGQRNRLTQEVLSTLDNVGTGTGVVVPVKIASEKNREYVLIRNEGVDGGFTLGMRQQGNTADKPIVVEEEDEEGDDSFDSKADQSWEDIAVPGRTGIGVAPDQDWRDYKRDNALAGLSKRDTDKRLAPLTTKSRPSTTTTALNKGKGKATDAVPLDKGKGKAIDSDEDDEDSAASDLENAVFQLAMNASLAAEGQADEDEEDDIQRALALSLAEQDQDGPGASFTSGGFGLSNEPEEPSDMNFASSSGMFGAPTGLFGAPTGLLGGAASASSSPPRAVDDTEEAYDDDDEDMDMEEVVVDIPPIVPHGGFDDPEWEDFEEVRPSTISSPKMTSPSQPTRASKSKTPTHTPSPLAEPTSRRTSATRRELAQALSSSGDEDDEVDAVPLPSRLMTILAPYQTGAGGSPMKKASETPVKRSVEATPVRVVVPREAAPPKAASSQASPTKKAQSAVGTVPSKRVGWSDVSPTKGTLKASPLAGKAASTPPTPEKASATPLDLSDEDMDEVAVEAPAEKLKDVTSTLQTGDEATAKPASMPSWFTSAPTVGVSAPPKRDILAELTQDVAELEYDEGPEESETKGNDIAGPSETRIQNDEEPIVGDESHEFATIELSDDNDEIPIAWSRSPTPSGARSPVAVPVHTEPDYDSARSRTSRLQAEDQEHASFMSNLQNKSYATMRESLDAEIAALRKERAAALRDAEDITAQMSAQIQVLLRLFGVPFLNAPMEAEAQCAFLAQRGLVQGVITDDSDVFLFGAGRVFRNMFNQSKTVECFFAADLERELGLDRETLIGLAFLLGSDYTEGLQGVGPVVAMEIMKEFPGEEGLKEFREWWRKIQVGKDTDADLRSTFRKRFKKKFKTLHLTEEWPNPKVREAYLDPAVDQSEERFQWGLPDLDGLRQFLGEELSWNTSKVDETLLPIIRRMTQRTSAAGANRQGTLTSFLDVTGNPTSSGATHAPRKRQAYASKRLQQVVSEYRARKAGEDLPDEEDEAESESGSKAKRKAKPKAKPTGKAKAAEDAESQDSGAGIAGSKRKRSTAGSARGARGGRTRGARGVRGRGRGRGRSSVKADAEEENEYISDTGSGSNTAEPEAEAPAPKKPRLRPRMKKPSPAPQPVDSEEGSGSGDEYVE